MTGRPVMIHQKTGTLPAVWRLLGAEPVPHVLLPRRSFTQQDGPRIGRLFPEANVFLSDLPERPDAPSSN